MRRLFGTSGVRMRVADFPPQFPERLAYALAESIDGTAVAVGRDTRATGFTLEASFVEGLTAAGKDAIELGIVPTPTVGVAAADAGTGVMVTASHNPPDYNGFKLWGRLGAYTPEQEEAIETRYFSETHPKTDGMGRTCDRGEEYLKRHQERILDIVGSVDREIRVLLDCAGGAGSTLTPAVLSAMGCQVTAVNDNRDGVFPHPLEPTEENVADTCSLVREGDYDIGFVHDGDADRTAAIDRHGTLVDWDSFLATLAYGKDTVVTTVDASMRIDDVCGKVVRTAVGDVAVARGIRDYDADFGGEPSGTYIFPDVHPYPDGVATAAKVATMVADGSFYDILESIPSYPTKRVKIPCEDAEKSAIMARLPDVVEDDYTTVDGIRVSREQGWVLIRPSGTECYLRITAEAESEKALEELVSQGNAWIDAARKLAG